MKRLDFKNKWVLITGASSGLGYEIAFQLAHQHKANLIISARRKDKLEQLKTELDQTGIQVKIIVADLSVPEDVELLIKASIEEQPLYAAVLNAGITYFGTHIEMQPAEFQNLLQTNVTSIVRITSQFVHHFETTQKEGGLMVVSSMAALFPVPYQAIYSGTKAFIMNFFNALSFELKNKKFSLTVYAPGGIATEMTQGEKFNDLKGWLMPVEQAAKEGIYALTTRKYNYIPGFMNRAGSKLMKFLPKKFIVGQMAKTYRKSLKQSGH